MCEHSATSHKQQCGNISVGSLGEMMKGTLGDGEKKDNQFAAYLFLDKQLHSLYCF